MVSPGNHRRRAGACGQHPLDEEKVARFRKALPDADYVVSIFKAMGDETRLLLLHLMSLDEWCVHELAAILGTSVSNVSHHLRLLRIMRLVKFRREGRRVLYSLDDEHVRNLISEAFTHGLHERNDDNPVSH